MYEYERAPEEAAKTAVADAFRLGERRRCDGMFGPIVQRVLREHALREGKHIHTDNARDGEMCQGGDPECPLWQMQREEAMDAWSGS
jgi:hypothetical protein